MLSNLEVDLEIVQVDFEFRTFEFLSVFKLTRVFHDFFV